MALAILMSLVPPFIKWMGKISDVLQFNKLKVIVNHGILLSKLSMFFLLLPWVHQLQLLPLKLFKNPGEALQKLSSSFPKSVNFYYSYLCLQGLTISSGVLLQIVALILSHILGRILDGTPRAKWTRWNTLGQPAYSTLYPGFQLLTVVALSYSVIAPLILGFTAIAFILFYFAYIYTMILF